MPGTRESEQAPPAAPGAGEPGVRDLVALFRRHPRTLPERLAVFSVQKLGEPTRQWAQEHSGDEHAASHARHHAITTSRLDGAAAGTPFFIALVPAYVMFLWTQARMTLRLAALSGLDPADPRRAAEMLALRGLYPDADAAAEGLAHLEDDAPISRGRDRISAWISLVRRILVFASLLAPSGSGPQRSKPMIVLFTTIGIVIWAMTWVFPLTFMIVMSWACESATRDLAQVTSRFYDTGDADRKIDRSHVKADRGHGARVGIRSAALALSVAIPAGVVIFGTTSEGQSIGWLRPLAACFALALVLALAARSSRR